MRGVYLAPKFLLSIQDSGVEAKSHYSEAAFGGALAAGYNFNNNFNMPIRTEVECSLRGNAGGDKYSNSISTLFANAYYDIDTGTSLTPFIGGGSTAPKPKRAP